MNPHRTGPTPGICESLLRFTTFPSSAISKSCYVLYYFCNTNSEETRSQEERYVHIPSKVQVLFLVWQVAAAEDNLEEGKT